MLVVLAVAGCGRSTGHVTGQVTYKGQPLPSGTVLFHGPDGATGHSAIWPDGRYEVRDVPVGPWKITVQSHGRLPQGFARGALRDPDFKMSPREALKVLQHVGIPKKLADPAQSGLAYTVKAGKQRYDIALTP
jgi:hypothetical protein